MSKKYKIILILLLFTMITSCQSFRKRMIQEGFSEEYVDGYLDGVPSGRMAAGDYSYKFIQDSARYEDIEYGRGWDDGFKIGKTDYEKAEKAYFSTEKYIK